MKYKFDFIKNKNKFFAFSLSLIVIICIFIGINGVDLDIQFKGGTIITYSYTGDIDVNTAKSYINEVYKDNINIQQTEDVSTKSKHLKVSFTSSDGLTTGEITAVSEKLEEKFPNSQMMEEQISNVKPSIGRDFFLKSLVAIALAFIMMIIYIAIRFKNIGGISAGLMAVVALFHDVFIVFGIFVILKYPIDNNFIAVVLTILGYSVNDTIVIYDRVRENKRLLGKRVKVDELMNRSINQSLNRSINTTVSTVIALLCVSGVALYFNVTTILSFSIPMVLGMISGVYSTLFIAGPLWVTYKQYQQKKSSKR